MNNFKFGRDYIKIESLNQAYQLLDWGEYISLLKVWEKEFPALLMNTMAPTGSYGTSGNSGLIGPGNRGYQPPPDKIKNLKKYHFKGKYPKPR